MTDGKPHVFADLSACILLGVRKFGPKPFVRTERERYLLSIVFLSSVGGHHQYVGRQVGMELRISGKVYEMSCPRSLKQSL